VAVRAVTDRSKGGVRNSVRFGSAVPVTCGPAPGRRGPWMPRSPDTLPAPEYRLVLRVGFVPTPRAVMQAVFPWRQGTPRAAVIARMKFSLAELVPRSLYAGGLPWSNRPRRKRPNLCGLQPPVAAAQTRAALGGAGRGHDASLATRGQKHRWPPWLTVGCGVVWSCPCRLRIMFRDLSRTVCVVPISRSSARATPFQPFFQASWPTSERTSTASFHDHPAAPFFRPSGAVAMAAHDITVPRVRSSPDPSAPRPSLAYTAATA
jgi:hypothetical protein